MAKDDIKIERASVSFTGEDHPYPGLIGWHGEDIPDVIVFTGREFRNMCMVQNQIIMTLWEDIRNGKG